MSLSQSTWFSAALLVAFIMAVNVHETEGRILESLGLENFSGVSSTGIEKRSIGRIFDPSCKGIYDRDMFSKLERVCDDCYNLYRKHHVATECRRDCYNTDVFVSCLEDLMMHDVVSEYKKMAQMVAALTGFDMLK